MKLPKVPLTNPEILRKYQEDSSRLLEAMASVVDPLVNGKYLHWDTIRHLDPPGDFNSLIWWFWIKQRRISLYKKTSLVDKSQTPLVFALIDPIQESLQKIDSLTHGVVQAPEQVTNESTKTTYLVRSLIEESITSSQIEGASTTREVAKEMIRQGRAPRDRDERMILNNYRTMQRIGELRKERLDPGLILEIHRIVTDGTLHKADGAGRFRRADEEIQIGSETDGEVVYHVPPMASSLESRVAAICDFANGVEKKPYIHPAIRSIILHFMIGYDHPFIDGNGRTARALFYWSMLHRGYWPFEYISISQIIRKGPAKYGRAFLHSETDDGDITYFVDHQVRVICTAIEELYSYIDQKTAEIREIESEVRSLDHFNHRQRSLIGHALRHPGHRYTYDSHRTSHGVVHQTARTDIKALIELGLLTQHRAGGKNLYFKPAPDIGEKLRKSP